MHFSPGSCDLCSSVLHITLCHCNIAADKCLLRGFNSMNRQDVCKESPLMYACGFIGLNSGQLKLFATTLFFNGS